MLDLLMPRRSAMVNDERQWFPMFGGAPTKAGVKVDEISALNYSAVWRASRILTETVAGLPVFLYETDSNDERKFSDDPVQDLIRFEPNPDMSAGIWRERNTLHQLNWPGGFNEIEYNRFGDPSSGIAALWPIHPARVRRNLDRESMREYPYIVTNEANKQVVLRANEMLHICGTMSDDGIWGRGIITQAREDIGGGKATDMHGHAYFGSGAQPKGILVTPGMKQEEDRRAFRREWKEIHGSPDSSEVAILPAGTTYSPITISNADNQFLESRVYGRKVIMHDWYGLPLHMCGESVAHGSVEQSGMEYVIYTLYPWVRRQEEAYNKKLIPREQRGRKHFEHVFASLLRGDISARMNAYRVAIMIGVMTINECRRLENLNGIGAAGDQHFVPANMTTAERALTGDMGNGGQPGSDHTGAPADNPNDQPLDTEAAFDGWTKKQGKIVSQALAHQAKEFEKALAERKVEYIATARAVLSSAFGWILQKEANAAQSAAKRAATTATHVLSESQLFDRWIREFYGRQESLVAEAIKPACLALKLAGVGELSEPANLAAWMRERSTEELRASFNRDTKEAFANRLAAWPTERAERLVGEVFACGGPGSGVPGPCPGEGGGGSKDDAGPKDTEEARIEEDNKVFDERVDEDNSIDDSRSKEDQDVSDQREKEDDERGSRMEKEEKDLADAREKEDATIEKADSDREAGREKEDSDKEDRRAKEDSEREAEAKKTSDDRDKEDAERQTQREAEEAALDERDAPQSDYDEMNARHAKEDAEVEKARDKEDAKRDKEDDVVTKTREKEDAATEKAREKEDKAKEKEDSARERTREKEDKEMEKRHEAEVKADEAKREKEDKERDRARSKQDAELKAKRDKEDRERDADRAKQDREKQSKAA